MKKITGRNYSKNQQYRTSANLEARINLHRHFSINPVPWHQWVIEQTLLQPGPYQRCGNHLLELGCGPASLWRGNLDLLPEELQIVIGDLSMGMVREAKKTLEGNPKFTILCMDAQALPAPPDYFDLVVANHMLYHVPDIPHSLSEIARVLNPNGRLYAATNGVNHMIEMLELVGQVAPDAKSNIHTTKHLLRFNLENATKILNKLFKRVEILEYKDHLEVTEAGPMVDYIRSMSTFVGVIGNDSIRALEELIQNRIESEGHFYLTKSQGLVIAWQLCEDRDVHIQ